MPAAPIPTNEAERLAELQRYAILDTPAEQNFDDLTQLTSQIFEVPVCIVSLVDADRQWFKSCVGLGATQTPRDQAFCAYTILERKPFIVEDATTDPRVQDNALVLYDPYIRFYVGVPLISSEGYGLGSLCVIDFVPRQLSPAQLEMLEKLGHQVVALLEARLLNQKVRDYATALEQEHHKAVSANQAKSQFLATMSHEIRTPLNGVIGNLELLAISDLQSKQRDYVQTAALSAQALLNTINDVLDFSKIEAGQLELRLTPVNVADICRGVERILGQAIAQKQLHFQVQVDPQITSLLLDRDRLRQILLNLGNNAIKFTPEAGEITLKVQQLFQQGKVVTLRFSIQDTGIGIAPERQAAILKPFVQASAGTERQYGGTGLGLAICVRLLEKMQSHLELESVLGQGTTFTFELSAPNATPSKPERQQIPTRSLEEVQRDRPLKILIAEDNRVNQKIIQALLMRAGCEVTLAANGKIACELYFAQSFDVVLMDLEMPEMDGETATCHIRDQSREQGLPYIPIIALTAHALGEVRDRALSNGMDDYVTKPISSEVMIMAILRVLTKAPT